MWPEIPDWADPSELDAEVRRDLRGLSKEGAEFVAGHLIAAGTLADEEPEAAWRHARAARSKGGRIAVVRETVGLVAYRAGEWAEAISELRAARRMGGGAGHLPVMADSERALGHPDKAIELARSVEAAELDEESAAELRIVVAGARADLGQIDAALAHLEAADLATASPQPHSARLYFAYADLLEQAGRYAEALDWFMKAADLDGDDETDAGERVSLVAEMLSAQASNQGPAEKTTPPGPAEIDEESSDLLIDSGQIGDSLEVTANTDAAGDTDVDLPINAELPRSTGGSELPVEARPDAADTIAVEAAPAADDSLAVPAVETPDDGEMGTGAAPDDGAIGSVAPPAHSPLFSHQSESGS